MASKKANSSTNDGQKESKTRNWATVVYPESAPEEWRDILIQIHVPSLVSPLHDKDENPNGEPKKPHYHVLLMYDGPRERSLAQKDLSSFGGVGCEYPSIRVFPMSQFFTSGGQNIGTSASVLLISIQY